MRFFLLRMPNSEPAWFCVHTRPKCEHLAASVLRNLEEVETFCPRIRFQRSTRRGKVWFVEALFPSYFFARFDAARLLRAVKHSQNVIRVVEFGGKPVPIADQTIAELRQEMEGEEIREVRTPLKVGDTVELTEGPMRGLKGIVSTLLSGEERVRILLEFLGRESLVEVHADKLLAESPPRTIVASAR